MSGNAEQLLNSTVVSLDNFLELTDKVKISEIHIERYDNNKFAWVLFHV